MKTLPITIVACGLIAAYFSYPFSNVPTRRTPPAIRIAQQTKPETKGLGVYVPDASGVAVPMKIQRLTTSVTIVGTMAVTTVDMTVLNPHIRVLEGEFETPVMEGQSVCRFALDINGKLREGVVVEKEKARVAFESVVRQKIDPALLEWTRGNTFKSRIYPIPAKGTRRIVIAFEQELRASSEGYAYTLPFAFKSSIDTFDFTVDVAAFGQRPSLAGNDLEGVAFMPKGRAYAAEIHRTNVVVDKPFRCAIPVTAGKTLTSVNSFNGERYFASFIPVPQTVTERPAPKTITLLWDASLSSQSRDINKELDVLDAYFKRLSNVRVTLMPFSIDVQSPRNYQVTQGDWSALRAALLSIPSDGATQLGALPLASINTEIVLLVSDGVSTFGKHVPLRASRPLYAMTSAAQSDHEVLRSMAESSGGAFVNLLEESTEDALTQLTSQRPALMSIDVLSGAVASTYPVGTISSSMLTVGGILESQDAELELKFGSAGRVTETMSISINARDHADTGTAMARLWAHNQLRVLAMDRIRNEAAIVAIGKKFTIVTAGTSLLVLDRIQDYVQHRIEPPTSEPAMRQQYFASVRKEVADSTDAVKTRLNAVADLVAGRKTWYEKTFTARERKKVLKSEDDVISREESRGNGLGQMELANPTIPAARSSAPGKRGRMDAAEWTGNAVGSSSAVSAARYLSTARDAEAPAADTIGRCVAESGRSMITEFAKIDRATYFGSLMTVSADRLYTVYLSMRESKMASPGFFLDVSDIMRDKGLKAEALRVLSNMAELATEDPRLLRVLGQRLLQLGESDYAVLVFDDVKRMRGEEPQSYRDLGLACAQAKQYQRAVDNLYQVVTRTWDSRFPEIELIAVNEINRVLQDAGASVNSSAIDGRLKKTMPVDMRVVLSWDADDCDMDLWVVDPQGEKCYYSNRDTELGGHLSHDLTGGYGPEEFLLKKAPKGKYEFKVHYYGDRQQRLTGPTTITVDVFTNYGTAKETKKSMTVRVEGVSRVVDIGSIAIN